MEKTDEMMELEKELNRLFGEFAELSRLTHERYGMFAAVKAKWEGLIKEQVEKDEQTPDLSI